MLTEGDWRDKIATKRRKNKELHLKLFRQRKEIRKSEASKQSSNRSNHSAVLLIAFLKTKTENPASAFGALPNITISIPEQRRINPKRNGKKNFVLMNLCSRRVIYLVKMSVKRSHLYGIVESVIRKYHRDI